MAQESQEGRMFDIREPQTVQIEVSNKGVVWVNVDGECRLRVHLPHHIAIDWNGERLAERTRGDG